MKYTIPSVVLLFMTTTTLQVDAFMIGNNGRIHSSSSLSFAATTPKKNHYYNKKDRNSMTILRYEYSSRGDSSDSSSSSPINVWSVLANTEKWMTDTLNDSSVTPQTPSPTSKQQKKPSLSSSESSESESSSSSKTPGAKNPLARKEVSYVCETSSDPAMILAGIFRKLKEARVSGETHGTTQEELADQLGDKHRQTSFRQTQVYVIPGNKVLMDKFTVFDKLVDAINHARRNARDYITDTSLEKLDDQLYGDDDDNQYRDWSVSVNCGHLHPNFGEKTPEQELKELQEEDEDGEIDLNLKAYKERRLLARRSPYPSLVVETRAVPPPDFSSAPPPPPLPGQQFLDLQQQQQQQQQQKEEDDDDEETSTGEVTAEEIAKLEALFGKAAHIKSDDDDSAKSSSKDKKAKKTKKDIFYGSISNQIEEVSMLTPMNLAQNWISKNDPLFNSNTCCFTSSETKDVDEAYEFVFTNMAMQSSQFLVNTSTTNSTTAATTTTSSSSSSSGVGAQKRQYLVMSNFLTSSATSFEKFATEVNSIVDAMPQLQNKVQLSCNHPEHIDSSLRSPIPVFVLQWLD